MNVLIEVLLSADTLTLTPPLQSVSLIVAVAPHLISYSQSHGSDSCLPSPPPPTHTPTTAASPPSPVYMSRGQLIRNPTVLRGEVLHPHQTLTQHDVKIEELSQKLTHRDVEIVESSQTLARCDAKIKELSQNLTQCDAKIEELSQTLSQHKECMTITTTHHWYQHFCTITTLSMTGIARLSCALLMCFS